MSGNFESTPFHRIRIHISEASTQKDKGKLVRDITLELGNQTAMKLIRNKADAADIEEREVQEYIFDLWDKITNEGKKRGKTFIDEDTID